MEVIDVNRNSAHLNDTLEIYHSVFPEYERISDDDLLALIDACSCVKLCAYVENNAVAAMSFIWDFPELPFAYLNFLGVSEKCQGGGVGSRVLNAIKQNCAQPVMLDMEVVNDPNAENPEQRQRRLRFYQRNGFEQTGLNLIFEGIPFETMAYGTTITQRDLDRLMELMEHPCRQHCSC